MLALWCLKGRRFNAVTFRVSDVFRVVVLCQVRLLHQARLTQVGLTAKYFLEVSGAPSEWHCQLGVRENQKIPIQTDKIVGCLTTERPPEQKQ